MSETPQDQQNPGEPQRTRDAEPQPPASGAGPVPPANPFAAAPAEQRGPGSQKTLIWVSAALAALLFTGVMLWYVSMQLRDSGGDAGRIAAPAPTEQSPESEPSETTPGARSVQWPANMVTGGVLFTGDTSSADGVGVVVSDAPDDNAQPVPLDPAHIGAEHHIRVYLDYRCPYCAAFEHASADTLEQAIVSGSAVVELHPLTFLDRVSEGSYYSSRAAGALACVADAQPAGAWAAHQALLDPGFQPAEGGPGHDNAAILAELDRATDGLNDEARSCIEAERFVPFSQALNDWVFANPVPNAKDPGLQVTGTPLVVVDGVPYPGDPADATAFRAFLQQQGVSLD